jgi:biotin carboxyl carrier protein
MTLGAEQAVKANDGAPASPWRGLLSRNPEVFLPAWFSLVSGELGTDTPALLFAAPNPGDRLRLYASRGVDELQLAPYLKLLNSPEARARADIHRLSPDSDAAVLCYPIGSDGALDAAFLCETTDAEKDSLQPMLRKLQWGVGHLEAFFARRALQSQQGRAARVFGSLELALTTLEQQTLRDASRALATEMAVRLGARRVSIGVLEDGDCNVIAISHAASFAKESNDLRAIAAAMDEAVDQRNLTLVPNELGRDSAPLDWAHQELLSRSDAAQVVTVPFYHGERFAGALVAEWGEAGELDADRLAVLEAVTAMLAPVLALYRLNDRGLLQRLKDWLRLKASWLLGSRAILVKLVALLILCTGLFAAFYSYPFRVSADVVLEGKVLRAAVAPFDGYIRDAVHRAGDIVEEGDVLASLDDTEITLELNKWRARRQQQLRRLREARAEQNSAEVLVAEDQIREANAEIDLLEGRLQRTEIVAPFAGYLVSGDLSDSLGAPVRRGDVLFEVAPLSEYRIILRVDERDIRYLSVGDTGDLILRGLTMDPAPITVSRITPVAEVIDGINAFEVEAVFRGELDAATLLPGMEGVAKVDVGEAPLLFVLTRRLTEWVKLTVWSVIP